MRGRIYDEADISITEVQENTAVKFNIWHKIDNIFVYLLVDDGDDKIIWLTYLIWTNWNASFFISIP